MGALGKKQGLGPVALTGAVALLAAGAALLLLAPPAGASSYAGSGDWVIPANATETVVSEVILVDGNLTVDGTLNLFASTLTIDRNITVAGELHMWATSLTLTVDGPGTNYLEIQAGATFELSDLDGDPATAADAGVLQADTFGFHATVGQNATLTIVNSRVSGAGWNATQPEVAGAGFSIVDATVRVANTTFWNGWEVLLVRGSTDLTVESTTFDGAAVAANVTGGNGQHFTSVTLRNHTYGILLTGTNGTNLTGLTVDIPRLLGYQPPGAGPAGSGLDATGCTNLTVDGMAIQGIPAPVGTLSHTGLQIRGCTALLVSGTSSLWAGSMGRIERCTDVRVEQTVISDSLAPLVIADTTDVVIEGFAGQNGESGLTLTNVSAWTVDGFLGVGLTTVGVLGTDLNGDGTLRNATVDATPQFGTLDWKGPGNVVILNVTLTTLDAGLTVSGLSLLSLRIDGLTAITMVGASLVVDVGQLDDVTLSNLTIDVTQGVAISLNGTQFTNGSIGPITILSGTDHGIVCTYASVNRIAFHDLRAENTTGSMLVVNASGSVRSMTFARLVVVNTTGVALELLTPVARAVSVTDVDIVNGILIPSNADAGVAVVADLLTGGVFANIRLNVSLVGGVSISAGASSQFNITNVRGDGVGAPAVSVDCRGQACTAWVSGVTLIRSLDTAVLLRDAGGSLHVEDVTTDSPWGVRGERVWDVTVDRLDHNGTAMAVELVDSLRVTVAFSTLRGGIGMETLGGSDIALVDSLSSTTGPTIRARATTNLSAARLTFVDAGAAVRLLTVTGATLEDFTGSVSDYVLYTSQDSSGVVLRRVEMGTTSGRTAGVVLTGTRVSGLSVSDFNFTGPCFQVGLVQFATSVDVLRMQSNGCDEGLEIVDSRWVNLTDISITDVAAGTGLTLSGSSYVRVLRADLQRASAQALILGGGTVIDISRVNGSDSRGDGALIFNATDAVIRDSVFDGAVATSLFFLYTGPNVTLTNVSASNSFQGADLLVTTGLLLDGVTFAGNVGYGLTSDFQSTGNTFRNLTVRGNGWAGIEILANGTRLVDGNFSNNGASAIVVAPFVRLDWIVKGGASLVDDGINLTGDLTLEPGTSFVLRRARLVIDQMARLSAFQPIAVINVTSGALFEIEDGVVAPRDVNVPYVILISNGGRAVWINATVKGGNQTSPLSAVRLQTASADLLGGEVSGWHLPLDATDSTVTVDGTRFSDNWAGPQVSGGSARFSNVTSLSNTYDGFLAVASITLELTNFASFNNGGAGAVLQMVSWAVVTNFDARANGGPGLRVEGTTLEAYGLSLVGNGAEGLLVHDSGSVLIEGLEADSNTRHGAAFARVGTADVQNLGADGNGGSGLSIDNVANFTLSGASIGQNGAFGLHASGSGHLTLSAADLSDDALGGVRLEGSLDVWISAAVINSAASHAITVTDTVNLTMTDAVPTATSAGLLAQDSARIVAINCSMSEPHVVSQAIVWIGWHVRIIVQDSAGGPGAGVDVNVQDAAGTVVEAGRTSGAGVMPMMDVLERAMFGDGTTEAYGPHVFTAVSATLGRARHVQEVTRFLTVGLRLDSLVPMLSVEFSTNPGPSGWFLGPVSVTLRAFDDRSEGVTMSYRPQGGAWTDVAGNLSAATVTIDVDTEGVNRFEVRVVDGAGNELGPELVDVRVDLSPPTGAFGPADPVYFVPTFVPSWSGDDGAGSGVATFRVEYSMDNRSFTTFLNGTTWTQMPFEASDGDYRFRLTVFDAADRSSLPAYLDVSFALLGGVRMRVLDPTGAAVANTSVEFEDLNVTSVGQGDFEIKGLPAGNQTIIVSAPGFTPVRLVVNVTAREVLDLGEVILERENLGQPTEVTVLWGLLAGVAAATAFYWLYMRKKWSGKRPPSKEEP